MLRFKRCLGALAVSASLAMSAISVGCAARVGYRVRDPYYNDYHVWDNNENGYYNQWSTETHRDPHRDFRRLKPQEQREYWTWRHAHGDRH